MTGQLPSHGDRRDPTAPIPSPGAEALSVGEGNGSGRPRSKPAEAARREKRSAPGRATPADPSWNVLTAAKLKAAAEDPVAAGQTRELVEAALAGETRAIRLIGEIFRTLFYAKIRNVSAATGGLWPRHEMASDYLTFLVTGLRPSLRQKLAAQPARGVIPARTSSPLRKWLDKSPLTLWAFVNRTIDRLGIDLIRRARVQARVRPTDAAELELRSGAGPLDMAADQGRGGTDEFGADQELEEQQRQAMLSLAPAELTDRESHVLAAVWDNVPQKVIAARLGVSEPRISVLKSRAVAKLRKILAKLKLPSEGEGK